MATLLDMLPDLVARLTDALNFHDRPDLAAQLTIVELMRATFEPDIKAGYIYLTESRPLNLVEQNVIGVKHGESVRLMELPGTVVIDVDNFGRLRGIELLGYAEIFRRIEEQDSTL